jgi:Neutral/alkaline non-lysosomal ceramidase, N-terminal
MLWIPALILAMGISGERPDRAVATDALWKAGTARSVITPKAPTWMSGYAARTKPSQGVVHDLWAKALALEGPNGGRAILITLDVCGIGRDLSNRVRDAIQSRHRLERRQIVLACSHTHSGPVVGHNLLSMYNLDARQLEVVADYTRALEKTLLELSGQAIDRLADARLSWGIGRCDFAVNRRANKEAEVPGLRDRLELKGPVDHDVPVLRVDRPGGALLAAIFGYACHCTVLDRYEFCGDYAGFAQIELEARHSGAQAMFVAGCGADQNPIPRRSLELAARYGKELATSCGEVLAGPLRPVSGALDSTYEETALAFALLPSRETIEQDAKSSSFFTASRAKLLLETIRERGSLETTYPYPVQVWKLGELTWVFLGGEVVVDYSLRIKRNLGSSHVWVSAYCNDVMAYIPSKRVLEEGGYEGGGAMLYYGLPASWSPEVEETIISALARRIRAISSLSPEGLGRER